MVGIAKRKANLEAIHHYLTLQYVPEPFSAFEGIHKLEKSTYFVMRYALQNATIKQTEYHIRNRFRLSLYEMIRTLQ